MKRICVYSVQLVRESACTYNFGTTKITSPKNAADIIVDVMKMEVSDVERFGLIALDTKNQVIGLHVVSIGSLNTCIVHPREVFKPAILNNAAGIILFHNHPSGDCTPSSQDIDVTRRMHDAGEMIGIEVLDHIITGFHGTFKSMKEECLF